MKEKKTVFNFTLAVFSAALVLAWVREEGPRADPDRGAGRGHASGAPP
jgi:hypothetical protein